MMCIGQVGNVDLVQKLSNLLSDIESMHEIK